MKQGWDKKSLMEIASVSTGKWDANHASEKGDYRFYTCAYDYLYCDTKRFEGECLILPGNGVNVGEVFYYDGEFDAYQRTYVISDIKILPKYLHYHMLLHWKALGTKQQYGSATNFIKIGNFKDYEVQYPPLPEQQRIVSILDEAFATIAKAKANAEQNLKNAKELFESYLQGVFEKKGDGWEIKPLGEVSKINYGYTEKASFDEVGPKFLRITDIQENGVDWETVPYCKCSDKDLPKYKLETGDIVFARTGATTGKSYLIDNPPNSVFASYLIRLRMNSINEFIPEFISYFFQTKTYWDKINAGISGSAQGGFNATKLGELEFHFPKSKEAQLTIVRQLDALRAETQKLEAVYQKKIDDLEELKKSVLQKAFAGELKTENNIAL